MKYISTLLCFALFVLNALPGATQSFWEADFSGGTLPDGWAAEDISGNGVIWQGCSAPGGCGLAGMPPALSHFKSTTAANGFAIANSGAIGNLPNDGHISRLTSSAIDCNDKNQVFLQFQTAIGTASKNAANNAILRVMSNAGNRVYRPFAMLKKNGAFEIAPIQELAHGEAYFVTLDISEVAANQPQVYLEWEWRGNNEFAWLIDDVLLSTENPARPPNAVFYESFNNGSNGWVSNPVFPPDSLWKWSPAGDVDGGFGLFFAGRDAFIHTPSAYDGAMAFNADIYNTGGNPPGQGFQPKAFVCELISPPIDLSSVETPLALQFSQLGWLGNLANGAPQTQGGARFITSFAYSTNGGSSWSEPININPYQTPVTRINIEEVSPFNNVGYFALPEVEGSSDFRVKFTWAADFYFWVLDDIALVERPARDMKANRNFFAITPNAVTPKSQLQDQALLCDVVNIGSETAENVRLEAVIRKKSNNTIIYADTLLYGDIPVDSLVENIFFHRNLEAAARQEIGEYEAFYAVGHNQPDARPQDDTLRWRFQVSDFTFAKEFGPTRDIAPSESRSYSYGNIFYVPKGQGFYACAMSFGIANADQLQGDEVTILLYEWNGETDGSGDILPESYTFLAGNSYTFSELDGTSLIHLPISADGGGENLKDDTYYLLVVRYDSFFKSCFMQVCDTIDYQATFFVNDSLNHPQYASVLDVGNTGAFSTLGFGYNIVPVIRLHLGSNAECLASTGETSNARVAALKLSPNPAAGRAYLDLSGQQAYINAWLTISDLSGNEVRTEYLGKVQATSLPLDVSQLPSGMYLVKLKADGFAGVGKLVVQR